MGSYFIFREIYNAYYEERMVFYMSEWIKDVMKKYGVDAQEAIEIIARKTETMMFIHDYTNPYDKHCH